MSAAERALAEQLDENAFLLSVKVVKALPLSMRHTVAAAMCAEYGWDDESFMDAVTWSRR